MLFNYWVIRYDIQLKISVLLNFGRPFNQLNYNLTFIPKTDVFVGLQNKII